MTTLTISLVGRTNVGKSSLFNKLVGKRLSIIGDGLSSFTRDRIYGDFCLNKRNIRLIDTGGIEFNTESEYKLHIKNQTDVAISESDIVFFLVDGRVGLTNDDQDIANILRKSRKNIYLLINKTENKDSKQNIAEFFKLGFKSVFPISGIHGHGLNVLFEKVLTDPLTFNSIKVQSDQLISDPETPLLKLAILGVPNSGKSSLINKFIGENRLLVSPNPGTTVDAVNVEIKYGGNKFQLTDTAGVRRKRSIFEDSEKKTVASSFGAIDRAQVVLILIDAIRGITEQDLKISSLIEKKSKGVIIVINKWDVAKKNKLSAELFSKYIREKMPFLSYAPIRFVSALTGLRIFNLLDTAFDVYKSCNQRISTGNLNKVISKSVLNHQPPIIKNGKRLKFFYTTQVSIMPPTFLFVVNNKNKVHFSYERYLINQLRDEFDFKGSPIRAVFRERS